MTDDYGTYLDELLDKAQQPTSEYVYCNGTNAHDDVPGPQVFLRTEHDELRNDRCADVEPVVQVLTLDAPYDGRFVQNGVALLKAYVDGVTPFNPTAYSEALVAWERDAAGYLNDGHGWDCTQGEADENYPMGVPCAACMYFDENVRNVTNYLEERGWIVDDQWNHGNGIAVYATAATVPACESESAARQAVIDGVAVFCAACFRPITCRVGTSDDNYWAHQFFADAQACDADEDEVRPLLETDPDEVLEDTEPATVAPSGGAEALDLIARKLAAAELVARKLCAAKWPGSRGLEDIAETLKAGGFVIEDVPGLKWDDVPNVPPTVV